MSPIRLAYIPALALARAMSAVCFAISVTEVRRGGRTPRFATGMGLMCGVLAIATLRGEGPVLAGRAGLFNAGFKGGLEAGLEVDLGVRRGHDVGRAVVLAGGAWSDDRAIRGSRANGILRDGLEDFLGVDLFRVALFLDLFPVDFFRVDLFRVDLFLKRFMEPFFDPDFLFCDRDLDVLTSLRADARVSCIPPTINPQKYQQSWQKISTGINETTCKTGIEIRLPARYATYDWFHFHIRR